MATHPNQDVGGAGECRQILLGEGIADPRAPGAIQQEIDDVGHLEVAAHSGLLVDHDSSMPGFLDNVKGLSEHLGPKFGQGDLVGVVLEDEDRRPDCGDIREEYVTRAKAHDAKVERRELGEDALEVGHLCLLVPILVPAYAIPGQLSRD